MSLWSGEIETEARGKDRSTVNGIQSIELGIPILTALAEAPGPLPLGVLSQIVGMAPGKAHKYLTSFVRTGLVVQSESGGRYDLGPLALELGMATLRRLNVVDLAQAALDDLRDRLQTTVSLAIFANRGPTIVRWAETPNILSFGIRLGSVMPLLTSSFGRAFAAFLDRRITQELIAKELNEPNWVIEKAGLRSLSDVDAMLAEFRTHRLAVAVDLVDPGHAAIAAPIFDHTGAMVAAISVIGAAGILDVSWEGRPGRELSLTARGLSKRLAAPAHLRD